MAGSVIPPIFAPSRPAGIVPVLWMKCTTLPPSVQQIQYTHAAFPPEYVEVGVQQLLSLKVYSDQYALSVEAIADAIVAAARTGLVPAASLDLENTLSAWDRSCEANPDSHKEGAIAKTCFVFISRRGWDWQPYPERGKTIGAMAQHSCRIKGDSGMISGNKSVVPEIGTTSGQFEEREFRWVSV